MASSRVTAVVTDVEKEEGVETAAMAQAKAPLHPLEEEEVPYRQIHEPSNQTGAIHLIFTRMEQLEYELLLPIRWTYWHSSKSCHLPCHVPVL